MDLCDTDEMSCPLYSFSQTRKFLPSNTLCMLLGLSECDNTVVLLTRTLQSPNFKQSILLKIKKQKLLLVLVRVVHSIQSRLSVAVVSARVCESINETGPIERFEITCLPSANLNLNVES